MVPCLLSKTEAKLICEIIFFRIAAGGQVEKAALKCVPVSSSSPHALPQALVVFLCLSLCAVDAMKRGKKRRGKQGGVGVSICPLTSKFSLKKAQQRKDNIQGRG